MEEGGEGRTSGEESTTEERAAFGAQPSDQRGPTPKRLVVVDTRSDAECAVSMIPWGALRQHDFERRREEFQECTVVCYW